MKSLPYPPRRLTEPRHLLTFSGRLRFAVQEPRVLIRLPKILALLATLLLAVVAVSVDASPAAAHGNHTHQISTTSSVSTYSSQIARILQVAQVYAATTSNEAPRKSPDQHGTYDCCCGSIMCHTGVTHTVDLFSLLRPAGARVIAEPLSGHPRGDSFGLERPPRSLDIA